MRTKRTKTQYLSTMQLAERLNCHPATVRRLAERGELAFVKLGRVLRFHPSVLDSLASAGRRDNGQDETLIREGLELGTEEVAV